MTCVHWSWLSRASSSSPHPRAADPTATGPSGHPGVRRRADQHRDRAGEPLLARDATPARTRSGWSRARSAARRSTSSRSRGTCATRGAGEPAGHERDLHGRSSASSRSRRAPSRTTLTTVTNGPTFTTGAITGFGRHLARRPRSDFGDQHVRDVGQAHAADHQRGRRGLPAGRGHDLRRTSSCKGADGCGATTLRRGRVLRRRGDLRADDRRREDGLRDDRQPQAAPDRARGRRHRGGRGALARGGGHGRGRQTFTLRNSGNEALAGRHAARIPAPGFAMAPDACSRTAVAPGATCTLAVAPSAGYAGLAHGAARVAGRRNLAGAPVVARVTGAGWARAATATRSRRSRSPRLPLARLMGDGSDNLGAALSTRRLRPQRRRLRRRDRAALRCGRSRPPSPPGRARRTSPSAVRASVRHGPRRDRRRAHDPDRGREGSAPRPAPAWAAAATSTATGSTTC